jgi:hypothetical protein
VYAFLSIGQSNALRCEPYLESALKSAYGPDTILIRLAVGGSWIRSWCPGGKCYDISIPIIQSYLALGYEIKGACVNQGEADTRDDAGMAGVEWGTYYPLMCESMQNDLGVLFTFVHSILGPKPIGELDANGHAVERPHWNAVLTAQREAVGRTVGQYDIPRPVNNVHYLLQTYPQYQVPRYMAHIMQAVPGTTKR